MSRIYLDNAATSWPKPPAVYDAVDRFQRELGASPGRGSYRSAVAAQRIVDDARRGCAVLLGVPDPSRIVFLPTATAGLNQAIHGLLRRDDHVVATVCEHNSVVRPLAEAARRLGIEVDYVGCDASGGVAVADFAAALRPTTRLAIATHASNVTGTIQPIAEFAAAAHARGAVMLVDVAQTAGHMPVDAAALGADLLVASGHKGLLGPPGIGVLFVREGLETVLLPVQQGGTGLDSRSNQQPDAMPQRYESGSVNGPALAGLAAATQLLLSETGIARIAQHEGELTRRLLAGLAGIRGVQLFGPSPDEPRAAVVGFSLRGYDPQELAAALDVAAGVECRAGLHCAPRMHAALGTLDQGGLVRFSPGWSTTDHDVDRTLEVLASLAES